MPSWVGYGSGSGTERGTGVVTLHEAHGTVRNRLIVVPAGLSSVSVAFTFTAGRVAAGGLAGGQQSLLVTVPSAHRPLPRPAVSPPASSMSPRSAASSVPDLRSLERTSWESASNPTAPSPARPRAPARPVRAHVRMGHRVAPGPGPTQDGEGWKEAGMAPIAGLVFPWGCEGTRERTVTTGQVGCAWPCSPTAQRWEAGV